jgi:hypothetical protein
MIRPCCETCIHWHKPDYAGGEWAPQECRRYPPQKGAQFTYGEDAGYGRPEWPLTFTDDWCSEHQPKTSP